MITRPIIIVGAPRSGTTIIKRCLSLHPDLWHLSRESHAILEGPFHPARQGYESNRVEASDVNDELVQQLRNQFFHRAVNLNELLSNPAPLLVGNTLFARGFSKLSMTVVGMISRLKKPEEIRFLEKTPKNTLRVSMLGRLFPDALYVWNRRRAENNIDSLIAGWYAIDRIGPVVVRRRFSQTGYPIADQLSLQDYPGKRWKFTLVPGWRDLKGRTVADVAAWQYYQCNRYALTDLARIDNRRVFSVRHEDFIQRPVEIVRQIFEWADLLPSEVVEAFAEVLPRVNDATLGARRSKNGLRHPEAVYAAIERLPELQPLRDALGYSS